MSNNEDIEGEGRVIFFKTVELQERKLHKKRIFAKRPLGF